jgi:hypothetical protein
MDIEIDIDRSALLDGIDDELRDAANKAIDAVALVWCATYLPWDPLPWEELVIPKVEEYAPDVLRPFRLMSGHDIQGMTDLIEGYETTLRNFTPNMQAEEPEELPELRRAYDLLNDNWYGEGAEAATLYVAQLSQAFQGSALLISEVAGGVIAARETIATARDDLVNLADTFYAAAEEYVESKQSNKPALGRMLGWTTLGVAVALVTGGGISGVVAAVGGIAGSLIANEVAKAETGSVSGDGPEEIIASYLEEADKLISRTTETAEEIARKIRERTEAISEYPVPPPPDVSPGDAFDPDDFRTDTLPGEIEQNVRDANVDIGIDGNWSDSTEGGQISSRLAGEDETEPSESSPRTAPV